MYKYALLLMISSSVILADDQTEPKSEVKVPKAEFTKSGHTVDKASLVRKLVTDKKAVLIDVREKKEWDAGHLKLARLVPLSVVAKGDLPERLSKKLPKDKPIYLHCRSGGRVLKVAEHLKAKGYDIRPLNSGYEKLLEEGFKKAKPKSERKKKEDAAKASEKK